MISLLDNDLYKFTMQQAVLELYPDTHVEYKFHNRSGFPVNQQFYEALQARLDQFQSATCNRDDQAYLKSEIPFLKPHYVGYLGGYHLNPNDVTTKLHDNGELDISIKGLWHETILWEVPLLATLSELYYIHCDTNWPWGDQFNRITTKANALQNAGCIWSDFGTRRRRNFNIQERVVKIMAAYPGFVGTSNVLLAKRYNVRPKGTVAHEMIMGISAIEGIQHANRIAMQQWHKVYNGNLGTALPDTFGTPAFLKDFDSTLARLFDDIRHDSGDPYKFTDAILMHYRMLGLDPMSKAIIYTDNLNTEKAIALQKFYTGKIPPRFGIGTHFTNDFPGSPPWSIVIKLDKVNGKPVVKLSDDPIKSVGDNDALRVARWSLYDVPLDAPLHNCDPLHQHDPLTNHLRKAAKIVAGWPDYKRQLLGKWPTSEQR